MKAKYIDAMAVLGCRHSRIKSGDTYMHLCSMCQSHWVDGVCSTARRVALLVSAGALEDEARSMLRFSGADVSVQNQANILRDRAKSFREEAGRSPFDGSRD